MRRYALTTIDPKIIGERIAKSRQARRLTQQQVADALNHSRSTISAMEQGRRRPRATELVALSKLLDRSILYFVAQDSSGGEPSFADFFRQSGRSTILDDASKQAAVQAYKEARLTIGQLAEILGTDILGVREIVHADELTDVLDK